MSGGDPRERSGKGLSAVPPSPAAVALAPGQPVHRPQGALRQGDGCVQWRLWAPLAENVRLIVRRDQPSVGARLQTEHPMVAEPCGYHVFRGERAEEGLRYMYQLRDGRQYPDPASRWQPDGVHDPSAVFFPETYVWRDQSWKGLRREDLVLYELHVGTFTPEGTFDAVIPRLGELKTLGVTAVEIMPVGQFPGDRNWGYDGVYPYAVQDSYGGPRGFQRLVDAAHQQGLAVFLDVVYNHFGPEGNYLAQFGHYFTDRYHTPWGKAVNFDGPHSDAVRRFVIDNARMWVRDFHVDGLRLDAVHAIYDFGARHILAEIQAEVQEEARRRGRPVLVIAETNQNNVRLVDPPERGGYGLDGVWSDDFHHSVRALLTGNREGYYQDYGEPKHLAKAFNDVYVYDGCYSPFRRRRHGSPVGSRDRTQFVVCIHNHDQVGNRAQGDRSATTLPPAAQRLACGLLMLSPCAVLLFMGEEYAEARPFPFFCSFGDPQLIEAVRRGRREEFAALQFQWDQEIPDPQDPETFLSAKLAWQWPEGSFQAQMRRLYADLLRARREWPPLRDREHTSARTVPAQAPEARDTPAVMLIQRGGNNGLLACANLTAARQPWAPQDLGPRSLLLSTEERQYGGRRLSTEPITALHPYELVLFGHWVES